MGDDKQRQTELEDAHRQAQILHDRKIMKLS